MAALTSLMSREGADGGEWQVVVNAAGHHSIWPVERTLPSGWSAVSAMPAAARDECLTWIGDHWTDSRPAGVGRKVSGA